MKILKNGNYGGLEFGETFWELFEECYPDKCLVDDDGDFDFPISIDAKTDPDIIRIYEIFGDEIVDDDIEVVDIPDDATDYNYYYDCYGTETVIYVVDGKIHYA